MRSTAKDRQRVAVWGEGFAQDGWSVLAAVEAWERVERDELARLFPRLVPRGGALSAVLIEHLADAVAAQAWHLRHVRKIAPAMALTSMTAATAAARGARVHATMFAASGRLADLLERWSGWQSAGSAAEERADLVFLDAILAQAQRDALASAGAAQTASFAFLSGLHPAYLWPSASATAERDAAAAWLGIVARGRPALMTAEVADYLADAVTVAEGRCLIRDPQMARFARNTLRPAALRAAAARARSGDVVVVRRSWLALRHDGLGSVPVAAGGVPGLLPVDQH